MILPVVRDSGHPLAPVESHSPNAAAPMAASQVLFVLLPCRQPQMRRIDAELRTGVSMIDLQALRYFAIGPGVRQPVRAIRLAASGEPEDSVHVLLGAARAAGPQPAVVGPALVDQRPETLLH